MPDLARLVEAVGAFRLRGSAMERAQRRMVELLTSGAPIPEREADAYIAQTRRYFNGFEHEARTHLEDLDRRLAHVSQLQFNLTAERAVAVRRIEGTRGVLFLLAEAAPQEEAAP